MWVVPVGVMLFVCPPGLFGEYHDVRIDGVMGRRLGLVILCGSRSCGVSLAVVGVPVVTVAHWVVSFLVVVAGGGYGVVGLVAVVVGVWRGDCGVYAIVGERGRAGGR